VNNVEKFLSSKNIDITNLDTARILRNTKGWKYRFMYKNIIYTKSVKDGNRGYLASLKRIVILRNKRMIELSGIAWK